MKNETPVIRGFFRNGMNNYEIIGAFYEMGEYITWNYIQGQRLAAIVVYRIYQGDTAAQALSAIGFNQKEDLITPSK